MASSTSSQGSPMGVMNGMEMLDFDPFQSSQFDATSTSPDAHKPQFARPSASIATPALLPSGNEMMSGPSHQYDLYKQQTPFVPGAVTSTMNQNMNLGGYNLDFNSTNSEVFDFNAASLEEDQDLEGGDSFFNQSLDTTMGSISSPSAPSVSGRMYPGIHQELQAKADAQQRQQRQIVMGQQQHQIMHPQQRQQGMPAGFRPAQPQTHQPRSKSQSHAQDPLVEQKITQLLNSMRAKSGETGDDDSPLTSISKLKKDEEDMDEDERLLASEEGKKLSSKERRQLRNKVSARAFRSRRKEYIGQLEAEIASKVTENTDLRQTNRALMEENRRLSELTRTLLSSPQFGGFLENLSTPQPSSISQQPTIKTESHHMPQQQQPQQQQQQQQQMGMAMMPDSTSFDNINLDGAGFYQAPRVYTAVVETPELPEIDTSVLSGKSSNFADERCTGEDKLEVAALEAPVSPSVQKLAAVETESEPASSRTETDLDGDIYDDEPTESPMSTELNLEQIVSGIVCEKPSRYELVISVTEDAAGNAAVRRVEGLQSKLESALANLNRLTGDL